MEESLIVGIQWVYKADDIKSRIKIAGKFIKFVPRENPDKRMRILGYLPTKIGKELERIRQDYVLPLLEEERLSGAQKYLDSAKQLLENTGISVVGIEDF